MHSLCKVPVQQECDVQGNTAVRKEHAYITNIQDILQATDMTGLLASIEIGPG